MTPARICTVPGDEKETASECVPSTAKAVEGAAVTPAVVLGRIDQPSVVFDSKVQTPHAGALVVLQLNGFLLQR